MNILVLNRFPISLGRYPNWIDSKENVFFLTSKHFSNDFNMYENKILFNNYVKNTNVERRAIEIHEKHKIDKIVAISEPDLIRAARLRKTLNVDSGGQNLESAFAFRDKVNMKAILKEKGINVPIFSEVHTIEDILNFIGNHGYPFIIKPRMGSSSQGVQKISDKYDLETYLETGIESELEIEKFIEGEMYHIDGLIFNHEMVFSSVGKYINGCLAFKDGKGSGVCMVSNNNDIYTRMKEFVNDVILSLPSPQNATFHCELFLTKNNEIVFCEIASRSGGARIGESIIHSYGIDLDGEWVQNHLYNSNKFYNHIPQKILTGTFIYPKQQGKLEKIPQKLPFDFIVDYSLLSKQGDVYKGSTSSIDAFCSFIVEGKTEEEVIKNIHTAQEYLEKNITVSKNI